MNDIKKPTLLIVDDEEYILKTTKSLLRREYNIFTFSNPLEVIPFLDKHHVDIVISDESMPQLRGTELVKIINIRYPDICKVILSGYSEKENIVQALNEGHIFGFLFKPIDSNQLRKILQLGYEFKQVQDDIKYKKKELENHNRELESLLGKRIKQIINMEKFFEVGKFTASIVHNLKNPLQSLIMGFEILQDRLEKEQDPTVTHVLDLFGKNLERMEKMIRSITQNVRSDQFEKYVDIDMNTVIKESLEYMNINQIYKYDVDLKKDFTDELLIVSGKPTHFYQIIANILKNSLDAMENVEKKEVMIKTEKCSNNVNIIIEDSGEGIQKDHLDKIFSSNFSTKPPEKGTGLGLSITKEMIEIYGGTISVESQPNVLTRFTISLPLKE